MEQRSDRFTALEDRFAGYTVYDQTGEKIGKVDDLFVDENDNPEYLGVKMGFLGTSSTLIPWQLATVEEAASRIEVATQKETAKNGPAFDDDQEITPEFENEVHSYYGLQSTQTTQEPAASYGAYTPESTDEEELRVHRSEEELRAGTREREAGALNVRKRVVTERQQVEVPTRREEVTVERVPVEGGASEVEIGDDEVSVPLTEEEVEVEKRPVAKEGVRISNDVVEDTRDVGEDVRR